MKTECVIDTRVLLQCPACLRDMTAGGERAGSAVQCPHCNEWVRVPSVAPPWRASPPIRRGSEVICPNPNCGFRGVPTKRSRGSVAVLLLLLLIGVIPGLIYAIVYGVSRLFCMKCGLEVGRT